MNDLTRFESRIEKTESCWNWTGDKHANGFGLFWLNGKNVQAHRLAYEATHGRIPKGKRIEHICNNNKCVNPDHLVLSTEMSEEHKKKIGDANRGKTHETGKEKGIKTSITLYSKHLTIVSEAIESKKGNSLADVIRKALESF